MLAFVGTVSDLPQGVWHRVRITIKPLAEDSLADYLALMPRDRSEEPLPG